MIISTAITSTTSNTTTTVIATTTTSSYISDNFMSAQEALEYGLIDEIVQPNDEKIRTLALPPPKIAPQLFGDIPEGADDYEFGKIVSVRYTMI
jgi:hypothetical protein